jgi:hypothetical protein
MMKISSINQYLTSIGVVSMKRLGIVLDFNNEDITIDEIPLPIRDISNLPLSKKKGLNFSNFAKLQEPNSSEKATQRVVHILDANCKKAKGRSSSSR